MQRLASAVIASAIVSFTTSAAIAGPYAPGFRSVSAPAVAPGSFGVAGSALADGRLIALTGTELFVETGVGTGVFTVGATIDAGITGGTDPGFLTVSPDGSTIALGAGFGRPVVVFDSSLVDAGMPGSISMSTASSYALDHFSAAWINNTDLAVTSAGIVTRLDTLSGATSTIVSNIGGFSAGIAFDSGGRLYTGNGFDSAPGGSGTGTIRRFDPSEWSGGAADFENDGVYVADILSASPLHFDAMGHLIVGGGNGADTGYVAVADAAGTIIQQLDPLGTSSAFYGAFVNHATGELVVTAGSDWFVYTVPAPGAAALFGLATITGGRRRRAC